MKEICGVSGVRKIAASYSETQDVTVTDASAHVRLSLSANSYPADLTPEQARHVAYALLKSARKVEKNGQTKP